MQFIEKVYLDLLFQRDKAGKNVRNMQVWWQEHDAENISQPQAQSREKTKNRMRF